MHKPPDFAPKVQKPPKVHKEPQKFKCDFCDSSFTKRCHLVRHVNNVHNRGKFPCDQCDLVSVSEGALAQHKIAKHTEFTKDFHCLKCERSFRYKRELDRHEEYTHKKDPVSCEICGKEIENPLKLKTHIQSMHSGKAKRIRVKEKKGTDSQFVS